MATQITYTVTFRKKGINKKQSIICPQAKIGRGFGAKRSKGNFIDVNGKITLKKDIVDVVIQLNK